MKNTEPGEIYRHSKAGTYTVIGITTDEKTEWKIVFYRDNQTSELWSRPLKGTIDAWMTTINDGPEFRRVDEI